MPLPNGDDWIAVDSTCLSAIRVQARPYAANVVLTIQFRDSGRRYSASVPHEEVANLLLAPSIGRYYNHHLRDAYHWSPA